METGPRYISQREVPHLQLPLRSLEGADHAVSRSHCVEEFGFPAEKTDERGSTLLELCLLLLLTSFLIMPHLGQIRSIQRSMKSLKEERKLDELSMLHDPSCKEVSAGPGDKVYLCPEAGFVVRPAYAP